jgi:hypothetical protein
MSSELLAAARRDDLPTIADALMQWVLRGYSIMEIIPGHQHVLHATTGTSPPAVPLPLYMSGPAEDTLKDKIWQLLDHCLYDARTCTDDATVTAVLRVLVMRDIPCPVFARKSLQRVHADVGQEWVRLQVGLAQRRALLDEHCPLIAPLRALIHGYNVPTTTEEFWATGLDDESTPLLEEPTPLTDEPTPLSGAPARRAMPSLAREGRWCCLLQ